MPADPRRRIKTRRIAALAGVVGLSAGAPAAAYEEKLTLELGLGPALATLTGAAPGGQFTLGVTRGLSSSLSIGGDLQLVGYATPVMRGFVHPSFEALYLIDVVGVVPRFAMGLGPAMGLERSPDWALAGHVRVGVDFIRPRFVLGFEARLDGALVGRFPDARRLVPSLALRYVVEFDRY